jgi:glycosyltransferase involved in cell wall biosynthesis
MRVVGAGSERFDTMTQGVHTSVDVAGWVPELSPEFHRARVFLAPLRYGAGTKGKILNAMSHGVPVVTTSVGAEGNDETILASMRIADDAESLGELVAELMTDDQMWNEARRNAIEAGKRVWERQAAFAAEFVDWVRRRAGR